MERKACCHVANAFLSRPGLMWPISRLEISKMSKKYVSWAERPVNGLEERPLFFRGVGWAKTKPAEKKNDFGRGSHRGKI